MEAVLKFIADTVDIIVLVLFLISSIFLLFFDCKEYKKENYIREYKFSKFFGYFYITAGIVLFIVARYIRL